MVYSIQKDSNSFAIKSQRLLYHASCSQQSVGVVIVISKKIDLRHKLLLETDRGICNHKWSIN